MRCGRCDVAIQVGDVVCVFSLKRGTKVRCATCAGPAELAARVEAAAARPPVGLDDPLTILARIKQRYLARHHPLLVDREPGEEG